MRKIPIKVATQGMVIIFVLTILFHVCILLRILPANIVWGGNLNDRQGLIVFESISILLNTLMLFFVLAYAGKLKLRIHRKTARVVAWMLFTLFLLNTLGNFFSKNSLETYLFTPITALLALFSLRIALDKAEEPVINN